MEKKHYIVGAGAFEIGYADLKSGPVPILEQVIKLFKRTEHALEVAGHTADNTSNTYNIEISMRRAESLAHYLCRGGVSRTRMLIIGRGSSMPIATNTTAAGRELNRRVEVTVTPA